MQTTMVRPAFLTVEQVAAVSTVPRKTLWGWAGRWDETPTGPEPRRLGPRQLRYRTEHVAEWLGEDIDQMLGRLNY